MKTLDDSTDLGADLAGEWKSWAVVGLMLALPVMVGTAVAIRWGTHEAEFYETVSQIIATLFIAIVVEFFTPKQMLWEDGPDHVLILILLSIGSSGLFGSLRGILGGGGPIFTGVAAAGLMACTMLVSLALLRRIRRSERLSPIIVIGVLLLPAIIILSL